VAPSVETGALEPKEEASVADSVPPPPAETELRRMDTGRMVVVVEDSANPIPRVGRRGLLPSPRPFALLDPSPSETVYSPEVPCPPQA
jgi:hypothetical protein